VLLVTGKGYPCLATREFLVALLRQFDLSFYGLFDYDPYGIEIYSVYKYGSKVMLLDISLAVPLFFRVWLIWPTSASCQA